ncbi:hypothetical protein BCY84_00665 [Trypanosoma cruzi cruzi]|uniref:Uncharacterized protein n=1 Tax=Trypanosoma cruzi TaxID=5693 RepID=A0A2V2VSC4_TRYCR|nr:hypothetical protein BCY84_15047 [Trypanosoma cruzi cruzi]PWU99028.1 hypothetical protein C4B63_10g424 [Trypanosoma cruzi]PBJ72940.1 hypothetical protein BCY84_15033 [Trypanosoma cruzi cruzi]PBJ81076.1 hypothetical protein BCY84_00662 [Trypanosoma cruzi cruzi]PBJ81078.1 hypothetical protein BCY84_00665 [Trypanosoma cruzi cruzi]
MRREGRRTDKTWMKNHPMEGDDIVTSFYDVLCKRNPRTMKPCRNVFVPDTVVYERSFPRGWYTTDVRAREVMRRQGKDLDAATIEASFGRKVSDTCPIVATYLSTLEECVGNGVSETTTQVEVLNTESVGGFIARKKKREGILQRFVLPKGYHNSVIRAVWSPRVAMVQRRTNRFPIMDRKRAEKDPFAIAVTYEGPEYLSEEGTVSAHVALGVKSVCAEIVTHFFYTEHKHITRMVLYFKSDARDRLWLLWCGSLRVADRNSASEMPVNLAPRFGEPAPEGELDEDEVLRTADRAYFLVTRDEFFHGTYMRGNGPPATDAARPGESRTQASVASGGRGAGEGGDATVPRGDEDGDYVPAELRVSMERLHVQEELVLDAFRDVFYRAYSHFLSGDAVPFELRVPPHVVSVLTEGCVADLMRVLKLCAVPCAGGESGGAGEDAMVYTIPPHHRTPLTQLGDTAANWIREHFASRWEALRRGVIAGGVPSGVPSAGAAAEQVERRVGDGQGADSRTEADATGACGGTVDPCDTAREL